jgi:hypothetical protein
MGKKKEPDPQCKKCGDTGEVTCCFCNGSGEGQADGSRCRRCWGGVVPCSCREPIE